MSSNTTHRNNFDFLRILAALMVLFSHQFAVLDKPQAAVLPGVTWGAIGVYIFFSISGFLVTQSWMSDPHPLRFIARRFLRIWPALFVVTCVTALVLGPLVTSLSVREYFGARQTLEYFQTLRLHMAYELPGVFTHNPIPRAVNGPIWTIPLEVRWYWIMLAAGVLRLLKFRWIVLAALLALAIYHFGIYHAETNQDRNFGREYGLFFTYGVCLYLFLDAWKRRMSLVSCVIGACAAIALVMGHAFIALWLVLPYAVIAFGVSSTPIIRRFDRLGDLSYGVYIYAFPVQQLVVWLTAATLSVPVSLALSVAGTLFCAFCSWHLVEKQARRLKPRSRARAWQIMRHPANVDESRAPAVASSQSQPIAGLAMPK